MRMLQVYVAGASQDIPRAKAIMQALRGTGMAEITHDWIPDIENSPGDENLTPEQHRPFAEKDVQGVIKADMLWLLTPEFPSSGAWVELGVAIGYRLAKGSFSQQPIVISSGPKASRNLFCSLSDQQFDTDDAAFAWIQHHVEAIKHAGELNR